MGGCREGWRKEKNLSLLGKYKIKDKNPGLSNKLKKLSSSYTVLAKWGRGSLYHRSFTTFVSNSVVRV
jgi:hypothetical protein